MRVLVTGGAGYIGSFVSQALQLKGHDVLIADDMTYGHAPSVTAPIERGDIGNRDFVTRVLENFRPDAVMHLAAWIEVAESVENPAKYFANNTGGTAILLECMARSGVSVLVFSSTAAVYGSACESPISEASPTIPDSPYGLSKLLTEMSLPSQAEAYGLRYTTLRYFNAAGGALDGSMGSAHEPATHLITNAIRGSLGRSAFNIFGNDYPTSDGTCVRDYIHVLDIAEAHAVCVEKLSEGGQSGTYNVGTGQGWSNLEVVEKVREVTGSTAPITFAGRRPGDPAELVADSGKLTRELGWRPAHSDLDTIVRSAYLWEKSHPAGYGDGGE